MSYLFLGIYGLKFRKLHVPNGTVHSGFTDLTWVIERWRLIRVKYKIQIKTKIICRLIPQIITKSSTCDC